MSAFLLVLCGLWASASAGDRELRGELGVSTGPLDLLGKSKDVLDPAGGVRVNGGVRVERQDSFVRYGLSVDLFLENGLYYESQLYELSGLVVPGDIQILRFAPQVGVGHTWSGLTASGRLEAGVQRWSAPMSEEYWSEFLAEAGASTPLHETGIWAGAGLDGGLLVGKSGASVGLSLDLDWVLVGALNGPAWSPRLAVNLPL